MNASQIHLAFTHLPVVLSLVGMIVLVISFFRNNISLRRTGLYILVVAGLAALPVFFSGEGAEEIVEGLPGVSEPIIEEHESVAKLAFFTLLAAGLLSGVALIRYLSPSFSKTMTVLVLLASIASSGLMAQAAHLGGQIRHTEIRGNAAASQPGPGGEHTGEQQSENEKDD